MQSDYTTLLSLFAVHFDARVWKQAQVLLTGTILARGQRTVCAALRVMGLSDERHFQNYHRVLNRAVWSCHALARTLLQLLVRVFVPDGPILIGGDETIERRRGAQINAKGIYRDPVRSSRSHFVKTSGLRWITLMLLSPIPFAQRVWALPFLTMLAPSERYYADKARAYKTLLDWMRQALLQVRRWLPARELVFVGDNSYAAIAFLWRLTQLTNPIKMVVRFRMDAALFALAPQRGKHTNGRPPKKGKRLPTLEQMAAKARADWEPLVVHYWYGEFKRQIEIISGTAVWYHGGLPVLPIRWVIVRDPLGHFKTQALLCTDQNVPAKQIVEWFVQRWQLEVTNREVREHLGVETQRQWSDLAIARATPLLYGLFSLITLLAHRLSRRGHVLTRQAAWYDKPLPTFSDALAAVRRDLWRQPAFCMSVFHRHIAKLPAALFNRLADALCYT